MSRTKEISNMYINYTCAVADCEDMCKTQPDSLSLELVIAVLLL